MSDLPPPSLEGPRAKVGRARHHLETLYSDYNGSVGPQKNTLIREDGDEPRSHVFKVGELVDLPADWGLVVGDFAHNLRSALDHLVWQLVRLSGNRPGGDNQFPICSSGTQYWCSKKNGTPSVRDHRLRGVAEQYRTRIDAVQPYRRGQDSTTSPLDGLRELSNLDKHRVIQAAFSATLEPTEQNFDVVSAHEDVFVHVEAMPGTRLEQGTEVAKVTVHSPSDTDAKVQMKGEFPIAVAFGETRIRIDGLGTIYEFVRDFIESFAPEF